MTVSSDLAARPDTRSAIVDAAGRLLRQGGAQAVTTRAVAEAAGVPAPTIFRIFGDKAGLLDAVAEHVMATYAAGKALQVAEENGDPIADLRAAWRGHIDFGLANPDLFALLTAPGRVDRSPATAVGAEVLAARVARLADAGLLRVSQPRAVSMIHAAGTGVVLALLGQPESGRDTGLAEASLDAVLGGILTSVPGPSSGDLAALTVTFVAAVPRLPALSGSERGLLSEWLDRVVTDLQG
jgi:AcrR family transcriptional regulator